jgi:hypothetical protein
MVNNTRESVYLLQELARLAKNSYQAIGYEQITVTSSVSSLTIPTGALYALITVESSATGIAVRYLELGTKTVPTTTTGLGRSTGDAFDVSGSQNLNNFRAVQAQAGTHTLNVQYYG